MDAVKFIKEMGRMCKKHLTTIVEQWSKEHPAKTYKDDFLEKFPNAVIAENICRYHVYKTGGCDGFTGDCELCWNEPIEE